MQERLGLDGELWEWLDFWATEVWLSCVESTQRSLLRE